MQNVNLIWISLCSRLRTMASPNSSPFPVSCRQFLDPRVQCLWDPCHYPRGPCLRILAWCLRCPQIRCPSTHRVTCLKDLVVSLTGEQSDSSHVNQLLKSQSFEHCKQTFIHLGEIFAMFVSSLSSFVFCCKLVLN